ncbi:hypothetical protein ADK67_39570 [Saccharothrix sp. NRRL B-16348]|uniref:hypothetical protein n=1 Tax=Saccharothrix sp. NRRL B-16348 TaxID=1415542 RepID=UPI0006B01884|nr:hypothetical protein [Saccharothrix sp. NRRL B-16348]KOX16887.1 hypothetical protein ADK67_39570 [Saccharothrix sp. NRRL B-16348]
MTADLEIPKAVREAVVRELFLQVESLDWEAMSARDKTRQYARWIEDPAIGGELADWYTAEHIRVWLKDGPLKEYARALEGVGPFAEYTTKRLTDPAELVRRSLGDGWNIVPNSIREKPMHCQANLGSARRYVCWGKPGTFRDLLWAAVNAAVEMTTRPMIVVTLREGQQIDSPLRRKHERLAHHCSLDLAYVERHLVARTAGG